WGMSDPENDAMASVTITSLPSHGFLTQWGNIPVTMGQVIGAGEMPYVTYTSDPNWHGTDGFDYKVTDSYPGTSVNSAHVTVNVTGDQAPVAQSFSVDAHEGQSVLLTGWGMSDPENDDVGNDNELAGPWGASVWQRFIGCDEPGNSRFGSRERGVYI
ncbi:MAG: Ig-like domain-containing protein, partial [Planctomycetota bacterium]|nr:Ig-like domain-containing protein [Planctomycetota bacterium]